MEKNFLRYLFEKKGGKEAIQILEILKKKKDVNEFLISKKTNMTINQVRNILYKLAAEGLVSFTRKKDKRKGWFIYFWSLNEERCWEKIEEETKKEIEDIKKEIERRMNERVFYCEHCDIEVNEELALERDFICPECANPYSLRDPKVFIEKLNKELAKREREIKTILSRRKEFEEKEKKIKKEKKLK